jgi:hypothetical protein
MGGLVPYLLREVQIQKKTDWECGKSSSLKVESYTFLRPCVLAQSRQPR